MSKLRKAVMQAAAGNAGGATYVDDVFSTYLYDGANGSASNQAVTVSNGIDLYNEGGLIWIKRRDVGNGHALFDSQRNSFASYLRTEGTNAQSTLSGHVTANSNGNGFTLSSTGYGITNNTSPATYASWTFRKQPGFFDIVTYTGTGSYQGSISHNLGSTPGMILVKRTNSTGNWVVWHRSADPKNLQLNSTAVSSTEYAIQDVTSTTFGVTNYTTLKASESGATYVAYLFAHDAQDFGTDSDESIIKCGSYTGNASERTVSLGFEPQWVLIKNADNTDNWWIVDNMRGVPTGGNDALLQPNNANTEDVNADYIDFKATGFTVKTGFGIANESGSTYIYIAIRRPHKPASEFAATDLFDDFKYKDNTLVQTDNPIQLTSQRQTGGPAVLTDMWWHALRGTTYPAGKSNSFFIGSRLQGASTGMITNGTNAEPAGDASEMKGYDRMTGVEVGPQGTFYYWGAAAGNRDHISYYFRRAPGFFDVVAYTSVSGAINHNLGVAPEMVIYKPRSVGGWIVMTATDGYGQLDSTVAWGGAGNGSGLGPNLANATATTIHGAGGLYGNGVSMITYLFATVPGISKVGSYSGTGSDVNVNCGFTSGARFVLVKRTDSTGDWYVWDSARGIVAGNDGYLLLNSNAAEVTSTDYIDPLSSGFTITSTAPAGLNASGGTYIFLAIA